jgi:D-glycero-alpha-D-manno-heptose 1-phosphate guanylyltransferase
MIETIVLAGGFGTRLKSVISNVPKPMAPIGGKPFLSYLLLLLSKKGVKKVIIAVGYLSDSIIEYYGDRFEGMTLEYSLETEPLGTGGAIKLALNKVVSDHVLVMNGDTYLEVDISLLEKKWQQDHRQIIVGIYSGDTGRYGRISTNQLNEITGFEEKVGNMPGIINAGCYVLNVEELIKIKGNEKFSIERDYMSNAVHDCKFDLFITNGLFIDIGIPEDYQRAIKILGGIG